MLENTTSAACVSRSAERSALVADMLADVLRGNGHSLEGSHRQMHVPVRLPIRLKVYGESMLPALWPGDVVEIVGCSLQDVRPGEIVLALREGRLFLHRLVSIKANGFVLRGDSMPGPDSLYAAEALLGRLVRRSGIGVNWSRAAGMLLCHSSVARRLALKLHSRRKTSASASRNSEHVANHASAEFGSTEAGAW